MRRLILAVLFVLGWAIGLSNASQAAEIEAQGSPARKLQRGFLNVVLSPIELAHDWAILKDRDDTALPTWVLSIIRGSSKTMARGLVGAYEMVTAPIPIPSYYEPVMKPEFAWEYLEKDPHAPVNLKSK